MRILPALVFLLVGVGIECAERKTEWSSEPVYTMSVKYVASLEPEENYEQLHFVSAVAGLVNRHKPSFYIFSGDQDSYWLTYLSRPGAWLHGNYLLIVFADDIQGRPVVAINSLRDLIQTFPMFNKVVLYDPDVPSTSSLASTIAGVEDLLPVPYRTVPGSVYSTFVKTGILSVGRSLVGLFNGNVTGSLKCDPYIWAKKNYLDTGKASPRYLGYYIDWFWTKVAKLHAGVPWHENTVLNHDYFIAKKGFFFDLDVWDDEAPNDDPTQPIGTDYNTLLAILHSANSAVKRAQKESSEGSAMIHQGGFTPWAFKYVDNKHGGVPTEWQMVNILSSFNVYADADACCIASMANAAFFSHFPLKNQYLQNAKPTLASLKMKGYIDSNNNVVPKQYVMFYMGDYDSAAWLYSQMKPKWDDPARGKIPLGWAIDPTLSKRFPVAFDYIFSSLSPTDRLITGDSGAGYVNPTQFYGPRLPSKLPADPDLWKSHNQLYYPKFNISFTGFVIQGSSGKMTVEAEQLYSSFSPDGIVLQWGYQPTGAASPVHFTNNMPVFEEMDIPNDVNAAAALIAQQYKSGAVQFMVYRTILTSPSFALAVATAAGEKTASGIVVVEPLELSLLAACHQHLPQCK